MTGLAPLLRSEMIRVFQDLPQIQRVLLFGSRAMGTHREASDIDLAITGQNLTLKDALTIQNHLDDLGYPYTFDVHVLADIRNEALLEHITRVGVEIYPESLG